MSYGDRADEEIEHETKKEQRIAELEKRVEKLEYAVDVLVNWMNEHK